MRPGTCATSDAVRTSLDSDRTLITGVTVDLVRQQITVSAISLDTRWYRGYRPMAAKRYVPPLRNVYN